MAKRNIYLNNMTYEEAQERFFNERDLNQCVQAEIIPVNDALGRVSYEGVYAKVSCPHYNASAMDGIAVRAEDTFGATEKNGILLQLNKQFIYVNTGDMIPQGYDAVIMIEDVIARESDSIMIIKSAVPWQHIRPIGEDMAARELIIPSKHRITPVDIGALLAGGHTEVRVYRQPKIGIIPTGTELIEPGSDLKKGKIIDFNSRIFQGLITEWGGTTHRYRITKDDYNTIRDMVDKAVMECDVVIISAGSSAGSKDYTASVVRELGEVITHGVAVQPGKPVVLGYINQKPVVGVPGYPVSAYMIMNLFVKPLLYQLNGRQLKAHQMVEAFTSKKLVSSIKYDEYVRVKLGNVDGKIIASPLSRGAGVVMSLVRADGFLKVPRNLEGYEAGQKVEVMLNRDLEDILNTVVVIGSHDPILDMLSDALHKSYDQYALSSSHVGSMGGIMALKRGETHMAGVHLLNPSDGSYNIAYIKRYLQGEPIALIHLVKRSQGFMVKAQNPKNIIGFEDLSRQDIRFINRQKGSGTRMLLDYYLEKEGIEPETIHGYTREEFTHLTTAAAIAEGSADVALGIYSAAHALGLDFVPVCDEQYDLAIPVKFLQQDNIQKVLAVMKSQGFVQKINQLGGYDTSSIGQITLIE